MQITLEQYEKIQHYLDGLMTPQDEHSFLAELSQDLSLKESFDFEKELRQNLSSIQNKKNLLEKDRDYYEAEKSVEDPDSIRSLIEKAGNEWEEENKKPSGVTSLVIDSKPRPQKAKIFHIKPWVGIASAACVVLAVASLALFMPELTTSPPVAKTNDTLPAKKNTNPDFAKIIPGDSTNMNSESKKIDPIASFKKYYAKDDANPPMPELLAMVPANYHKGDYSYNEGLDLRNVPNTRGSSMDLNSRQNILQLGHYYKGLSYIETNDNQKAIGNLQWVIDSAQSRQLKIKAQWYLALVYLKENNIKKALPLFSSLSKKSDDVQYRKQAAEILETLKGQE
jgi:tetratricopeptide (TPR) repeat protein